MADAPSPSAFAKPLGQPSQPAPLGQVPTMAAPKPSPPNKQQVADLLSEEEPDTATLLANHGRGQADTAASPPVVLRSEDDPGPSAELASISVRVLTGHVYTVVVDIATEHVSHLKAKVEAQTGVEPDAQRLTVEGADDKPLRDDGLELSVCDSLKQRGAVLQLALQDTAVAAAWREIRADALAAWAEALRPSSLVKHAGRLGVIVCMYGASGDSYSVLVDDEDWEEDGHWDNGDYYHRRGQPNSHNSVDLRWVDDGTRSVVPAYSSRTVRRRTSRGGHYLDRAVGYIKRAALQCPSAAEFAQHRLAAEHAVEVRLSSLGFTETKHCREHLICLGGTFAIVACTTLAVAMIEWDVSSFHQGTTGSSSDAHGREQTTITFEEEEEEASWFEQRTLAIMALGFGLPCAISVFGCVRSRQHGAFYLKGEGFCTDREKEFRALETAALEEANELANAQDPLARAPTSNTGELERAAHVERADKIRRLRTEVGHIVFWQLVYDQGFQVCAIIMFIVMFVVMFLATEPPQDSS
jgi:hypothetical protein